MSFLCNGSTFQFTVLLTTDICQWLTSHFFLGRLGVFIQNGCQHNQSYSVCSICYVKKSVKVSYWWFCKLKTFQRWVDNFEKSLTLLGASVTVGHMTTVSECLLEVLWPSHYCSRFCITYQNLLHKINTESNLVTKS